MADLYYLSFRDVSAPASLAVTAAELFRQPNVSAALDWRSATLTGANWVPWGTVAQVFRGKRVCFLLPGFNTPFEAGIQTCGPAAQSYENLGAFAVGMTGADMVVPVLWPGDGLIGWSYINATQQSAAIGANFAAFLASANFPAQEVSFITHSLGARVVLETIKQSVPPQRPAPRVPFGTAIFMAAAVDNNALDDPYATVTGPNGLKRVVLLTSSADEILSSWFILGDVAEQALWWTSGFKGNTNALGLNGPVFAPASTARNISEWYAIGDGQKHGDYLPNGGQADVWEDKPKKVTFACSDVVNRAPFAQPVLGHWAADRTAEFRSGWTPRF